MNDIVPLITTLGAAGALFYVLNLIVGGKLHTDSEVMGLRADNADLKKINESQAAALKSSNEQQMEILKVLRALPVSVFDRDESWPR